MHIHILGVGGTFMGGVAALAKELGHKVSGSDKNIYPPMSTQLKKLGINYFQNYDPKNFADDIDLYVIGNVMSRGHEVIEWLLNENLPFVSGPEWLANYVLRDRWVIGVAGTHGKTTTTSMIAWILESAGLNPGYLVGGVPENFKLSARLGSSEYFVIESDEYDTAFFDKRAKFVHYRPKTLVISNLEFDHADIYKDLDEIVKQFTHLIRTVPSRGTIVINKEDQNISKVLSHGYWSNVETFSCADIAPDWHAKYDMIGANSTFTVLKNDQAIGTGSWSLMGEHNLENAVSAIAAANSIGVHPKDSIQALEEFLGVRRRLERKGIFNGVHIYDDFAHHPTAFKKTIQAIKPHVTEGKLICAVEFRSNTMRIGTHAGDLAQSLGLADKVYVLRGNVSWDSEKSLESIKSKIYIFDSVEEISNALACNSEINDYILIMSNGDFGGLTRILSQNLKSREIEK